MEQDTVGKVEEKTLVDAVVSLQLAVSTLKSFIFGNRPEKADEPKEMSVDIITNLRNIISDEANKIKECNESLRLLGK